MRDLLAKSGQLSYSGDSRYLVPDAGKDEGAMDEKQIEEEEK